MKQRIRTLRRIIGALLALLSLAFTAGCNFFDPVVSIGSPSPVVENSTTPADTAAPETPTAEPQITPAAIAETMPSASPDEANGAGAYTITADTSESKKTYYSEQPDENALRVENGAIASVNDARVEKRAGDAASLENVLQYGLNAAVLTRANAQLLLINTEVISNALGAGGVNAYGGRVQLENSVVRATGASAYALCASSGGDIRAKETSLSTQGAASPALIAGLHGQLYLEGGMAATGGERSPVIASSGSVSATGATLRANNAEAILIDGGSVTLTDCAVSGHMPDSAVAGTLLSPYCVALYQSRTNGLLSAFSMTRGALSTLTSDLFFVTNTGASIYLEGVSLTLGDGRALLRVTGNDGINGWGKAGNNGADCALIAKDQQLSGDVVVDELSSVSLTLRGSSAFTGTVNAANTARAAKVTLEDGTSWSLTDNAYLTSFTGRVSAIVTNGYTVFVNGAALTK
ncbi:MAG: hypothetical protein C0413_00160 [Clostridiales bacterium]|nr:hypothetical protein [Clostridiales bacterium]